MQAFGLNSRNILMLQLRDVIVVEASAEPFPRNLLIAPMIDEAAR
jgi:hypothetical protein